MNVWQGHQACLGNQQRLRGCDRCRPPWRRRLRLHDKCMFQGALCAFTTKCAYALPCVRAGLTIAGFYYVCLERASGRIEGFYFDPSSTPFQRLDLQASCPGAALRCQSFGTFEYR